MSLETKTPTKEDLKFPEFFDNKVSTRTFIISTNINIDVDKLFERLPVTDYIISKKKRGRKKKEPVPDPNLGIADGSIITIKYCNKEGKNMVKGVEVKKKSKKNFRNSLTIVIICKGKKVNFKVSTNGKIQMTGCKSKEQVIDVIKYFWFYIKDYNGDVYTLISGDNLELVLIPAMRNIDFNLGFSVNRANLSNKIRNMPDEDYRSMLEPSFGYTGVNIKFKLDEDIIFLELDKLTFIDDSMITQKITYSDYLDTLKETDRNKKLEKDRYNTFLVFHSGKVIMSGITEELMENTYYKFLDIIRKYYDHIKEKLD